MLCRASTRDPLLRALAPTELEVVAVVETEEALVDAARAERPDVVIVDANLLAACPLQGLRTGVFASPIARPAVAITADTEEHALLALEVGAAAYLQPPFTPERVARALSPIREAVDLRRLGELGCHFAARFGRDSSGSASSRSCDYLERITCNLPGEVRLVSVEQVDYITAGDSYTLVHAGKDVLPVRMSLSDLEGRLDPATFCRIHRSTIVRLDWIEALLVASGGDYAVRLRSGVQLSVGRARRKELARRLGANG